MNMKGWQQMENKYSLTSEERKRLIEAITGRMEEMEDKTLRLFAIASFGFLDGDRRRKEQAQK